MACVLRAGTGAIDFDAPIGETVTLGVNVLSGTGAIVKIQYGGQPSDGLEPFQFEVESGIVHLGVLFAAIPPARLQLVERCGDGTSRRIDEFDFNPKRPGRGYFIQGF